MKNSLLVLALSFCSFQAFAGEFYECGGFANVDEYRAGIDMETGVAGFFDNDATSKMQLTSVTTKNGQKIMIYEGKEAGYAGALRLTFNYTKKTAQIVSIDEDNGQVSKIGHAPCELAKPWKY